MDPKNAILNMKYFILILLLTISVLSPISAQGYWQQHVNYYMEIDMDVNTHQFKGHQLLDYTNNSPDTLLRVFYHLYFNAFQPGSMMDVRSRTITDPDDRIMDRISKLGPDEIGYLKVSTLEQDGIPLSFNIAGTILEVELAKPLLPNATVRFDMQFQGQVPVQIRRSGRDNAEGVAYSMSQWYPKISEYDYRGWHANPYVGREFYGVWGDFEVKLHIDKDYTVAASGYLQNPTEVGHGYSDKKQKSKKGKLTWHFKAPNVHDFMWAADTDYKHVTTQVPGGPTLHFFYLPDSATTHWEVLPEYTIKAFTYMSEHFGKYPYQKYSVIQGGDGGMEYPMATLITGKRSLRSLVGVTAHELIHSWYQSVLGTNESLFAWMDEGFTTFASAEVMDYLFQEKTLPHPQIDHFNSYFNLVKDGKEEPLSTHADHFNFNQTYSTAAYNKGSVFLRQLNYIIGEEYFGSGMLRYFNEWKFKHPESNDFKRIMEKESGLELDWYFEYWINSTKTIDYGIKSIEGNKDSTLISLERLGDMIMPIDLKVGFKDGSWELINIPLRIMWGHKPRVPHMKLAEAWPWTNPVYYLVLPIPMDQIESLEIDPLRQMADIDPDNNLFQRNGGKEKKDS
jgi:hypothetical protein